MRQRNEDGFRNTVTKDGGFSPHLGEKTATRLTAFCRITNQNKTKFVEACINAQLDHLERQELMKKTKEELIVLYLNK